MAHIEVNGVELEYEEFGAPGAPLVLLIMGLGGQLVLWPESFCRGLAEYGFRVVRFDNRDAGKSTHLIDAGVPDFEALQAGEPVSLPYSLEDMARDTLALVEQLGGSWSCLVGVSMGGMIAQIAAILAPHKVRALVSIMSTTSEPGLPQPKPEVLAAITAPPPSGDREDRIAAILRTRRIIESPAYPATDEELFDRVAQEVDRVPFEPSGAARQYAAILAAQSRRDSLMRLSCPTLVIHGEADPLIPVEAGRATADAIPGSRLVTIPGMGHDITEALAPVLQTHIGDFLMDLRPSP